jgi:hypothetical protein
MPLPEHRVLERSNRNQDNGEPSQPIGVELQPAIRADLLDPALWQDGLAKYARGTNLAVALADAAGRLIGSRCVPSHWRALKPCNCVADALARGGFVVARDRTGRCISPCRQCWADIHWGRWSRALGQVSSVFG